MAAKDSTPRPHRGRVKITQDYIKKIKPTGKREKYYDTTVTGLILRVNPTATNKTWVFDYRLRDGTRRLYTIGDATKYTLDVVKDEARKLAGQVAAGEDPQAEKISEREEAQRAKARTLQAFLEGEYWDRHLAQKRSGKATQERIAAAWKPFLKNDIAKLTAKRLENHRAKRLESGVMISTLNRDRAALVGLLSKAVGYGVIAENPVPDFHPIEDDAPLRKRFLGDDEDDPGERQRFMDAVGRQPKYFQTIVRLAMLTGARRAEILRLKWPAVSLDNAEMTVLSNTAKTQKTRVIPLPAPAVKLLRVWKEAQKVHDLDRHLFLNAKTQKPYSGVKRRWAILCRDAAVTNFRFHDLRHDYASRLVQEGTPLFVVSKLLGHADISTTQRYAHEHKDILKAAVKKLS